MRLFRTSIERLRKEIVMSANDTDAPHVLAADHRAVEALFEEITHHVKEEEKQHDNMFQQARAADIDLNALGEQLLARKKELKRQAEAGGPPPAELVAM